MRTNKSIPLELPVGLPPLQLNEIYNDDSFKLIERVPAKTVDLILEDMPYNTTACEWDVEINLEEYWQSRIELLKPTGCIILTASQPFTTDVIHSNRKNLRTTWYWRKERGTNFQNSAYQPMKVIEECLVFYGSIFNPIKRKVKPYKHVMPKPKENHTQHLSSDGLDENGQRIYKLYDEAQPENILEFARDNMSANSSLHPTQKPVGLFEYLIRTYTNEGDLVFDGFGGSGTTAIAAHKAKRNFIVIEKE